MARMLTNLVYLLILILNVKFISLHSIHDNKIKFLLFDNSTDKPTVVHIGSYGKCSKANLKVLVHGWLDVGVKKFLQTYWYPGIRDPYVYLGSNVVEVDWSAYSKEPYLFTADKIVPQVGNAVARFVDGYMKSCKISTRNVHFLGHSLGAHVIGFAGKDIQTLVPGKKIFRLTGLDPAGPAYKHESDYRRLSKNDGTHVDTIIVDTHLQGMNHSSGHVNFWCNGGVSIYNVNTHFFAPLVFQESILHRKYEGYRCKNEEKFEKGECANNAKNIVGESVDFRKLGDFYLQVSYQKVIDNYQRKLKSGNWLDK